MRFGIIDPHNQSELNLITTNLAGTNPWAPVDADIVTGPDTHLVQIYLYRAPSRLFENRLSGTVWIAGVSLTPSGGAAGKPSP
jgi:hypothetical protein